MWEGRCFCQKKGCIEKRSCFLFDQRGTWAARRKMEVYGWRKTQVYGYAAGREERFHRNRDFCSCSCRCAGVCVEGERCCTSGTGQDVNNTKMWFLLPSRKVLFSLFFPPSFFLSFFFLCFFFFLFSRLLCFSALRGAPYLSLFSSLLLIREKDVLYDESPRIGTHEHY